MKISNSESKLNWNAISAVANIILAFIALCALVGSQIAISQTNNIIEKQEKHFQELNRPFVVFDPEEIKLAQNGVDREIIVRNIGNTSANGVKFNAYYFDKHDQKQSLINESDVISIGILYPQEYRILLIKDPVPLFEKMKNRIFTFDLSYSFLDKCISYNQSLTANSNTDIRRHAPDEKIEACE